MKPEKKKKDPHWEMASPDAELRRRKEAPQWVENKIEKNRRSASDFVTRGPYRRLKQGSFEGRNRRETFDRRGRAY